MNRFFGRGSKQPRPGCPWDGMDREADEIELARRMRALAVELRVDGGARLRLSGSIPGRLRAALSEARRLDAACGDGGQALRRLVQDGRMLEALVNQAGAEGGVRLPAWEGKPRILWVAEAVVSAGAVDEERLMRAVSAFDDVQALTMAELWAAPLAVRMVLARKTAGLAEAVLAFARQRMLAEKWIGEMKRLPDDAEPAFFEHALHLASERELPEARKLLEEKLRSGKDGEGEMIRSAHSHEAGLVLCLDRLLSGKRMLDSLDWKACFARLSRVERELGYDPAGVYAAMDGNSRDAVRRQVGDLAARLHLSEVTVARHAVDAALEAARQEDARRGNVCWWLMTDAGVRALARRMGLDPKGLPRIIPDPGGKRCAAIIVALALAIWAGWLLWIDSLWLAVPGLPIAWVFANAAVGTVYPRFFRPARLLGMKVGSVPDDMRTLVVTPVLLSSEKRAREMCRQLETLGCLEKDKNIRYLLLGDFSDDPQPKRPDDGAVVQACRDMIREMNRRAGWEKYGYIHRPRTYLKADRRWMGLDRKRGALMALNRVLLDIPGSEDAFGAENAACVWLKAQDFRFVVTLDADTRCLPETVRKLIGIMAHPLNRPDGKHGYCILQPAMEMLPSACTNEFVRLFAGSGGMDTYPVSVSSLWQDLTGEGVFAGKGIYDVRAFYEALEGVLPEGRILSHDLIEGTIAGAGFAGNVAFYDGYPAGLSASMKRLNRWTRGDWQLLPYLFSKKPVARGKRLTFAQRLRMADNLLRSLFAPSLIAVFILSVWLGSGNGLCAGVLAAYFRPLLGLFNGDKLKWRRATAELAILPLTAWQMIDAVGRTLWRLAASGKHMLDWVTAADAEEVRENMALPGRVAAILLAPGLVSGGWAAAAVALGALFLVGPGWIGDMERESCCASAPLSGEQIAALSGLARDTWRFFEKYVPLDGCGLPPDNVQIDPPAGEARRTSPTNIGLYLVSCLAAEHMGFIRRDEMTARMTRTLDSIARMEKWNGHLLNWYDIDDLEPLRPRYVSSVDSGNLAACLLTVSAALKADESTAALALSMSELAENMDLAALYDEKRQLFCIGMDLESGAMSASHYDLLASESRILSYAAMMLSQVPTEHWRKLSRTALCAGEGCALASWSGTMFEYLMPEIFMRAPALSLIGSSNRAVVRVQQAAGKAAKRPWGVSESGYYAFDMHMNYQYRAFGMKALALGGNAAENVVAPYAGLLALAVDPSVAAENAARMQAMEWAGMYGLYEAADYTHTGPDGRPGIVKSHMAHHQGMILCALCNALNGNYLVHAFMQDPRARALELLLQEKPVPGVSIRSEAQPVSAENARREIRSWSRTVRPDARLQDAHLLYGGGATAFITADSAVHYMKNGLWATRFYGDLTDRKDGACLHVYDSDSSAGCIPGKDGRLRFDAGLAEMTAALDGVDVEMKVCLSPEDGGLYRDITLVNNRGTTAKLELVDVLPVALSSGADVRAHSAFRNLFVESRPLEQRGTLFVRRPREKGEATFQLVHAVTEPDVRFETDHARLVGRSGNTLRAGGITRPFSGSFGTVLDPVSAISAAVSLQPGETRRLHFAANILEPDDDASLWMQDSLNPVAAERAGRLASVRATAMLDYIGLDVRAHRLLQRMSALILDGRLAAFLKDDHRGKTGDPVNRLWETGISGDLPIILMWVDAKGRAENIHGVIRCHEFYRAMGLWTDLVLVNDFGGGYDQPVRDMIAAQITSSHLRDMQCVPGGVWVLDGSRLSEGARNTLRRYAAVSFGGERDLYIQIAALLAGLDIPKSAPYMPMDAGAAAITAEDRRIYNGYGGFAGDGSYVIDVLPGRHTPAPWCNILANDRAGMLLTERGGGFFWHGNSRSGRLTPFGNDALRENWGLMLYLVDDASRTFLRLLPGAKAHMPFAVRYTGGTCRYAFASEKLRGSVSFAMAGENPCAHIAVEIENMDLPEGNYRVLALVNWQMGVDPGDDVRLITWNDGGACYASGTAGGVGYLAAADPDARPGPGRTVFIGRGSVDDPEDFDAPADSGGWTLSVPVSLEKGRARRILFAIGWGEDVPDASEQVRRFYGNRADMFAHAESDWNDFRSALTINTPDAAVNCMANGFLIHQALAARIQGRTGFYQPGGAYGFRDQLQDMLAILHFDPARVRSHILRCAARQFEDGAVMHWWHEPCLGVRTRITDDMLFLPWVTAAYVRHTGDTSILCEQIAYLENVDIPEGREDVFMEMRPGNTIENLHRHCMRAFRQVRFGEHGLALMGAGDWNDGMNRVGHEGRGESVWLSEFIAACAASYAAITEDEADRKYLLEISQMLAAAIETHGWDGSWYLRAYTDSGEKLGGACGTVCRIDAISQAWAVLAGLNPGRCSLAMDSAWEMLVDREIGIVKLLTPPFDDDSIDPGYIRGYPAGVRENGAQYTHGACWLLLALIRMGREQEAHAVLEMLLPPNHSDTKAAADRYRVEPYVMAADVYSAPPHEGRGGWTWYTGAAAWMYNCILEMLGYERRANAVRLNAHLGDWTEASLTLRFGGAKYTLVCRKDARETMLDGNVVEGPFITLIDDGNTHEAVFPPAGRLASKAGEGRRAVHV